MVIPDGTAARMRLIRERQGELAPTDVFAVTPAPAILAVCEWLEREGVAHNMEREVNVAEDLVRALEPGGYRLAFDR